MGYGSKKIATAILHEIYLLIYAYQCTGTTNDENIHSWRQRKCSRVRSDEVYKRMRSS